MCNSELLEAHGSCSLPTMSKVTVREATVPQPRGQAFARLVLDVALTQLAAQGYQRLSIPEVAAQAGVNKTSVYRRWPTKAELVRDALGAAMSHTENEPNTGTLRGDLIALAHNVAAFTQSPVGTAVVRILLAEGGNPEVRALGHAAHRQTDTLGPWLVLKRAIERGELSPSADPSLLLFTIAGAVVHRVFVEQGVVSNAYLEPLVDMLLAGVASKR